jgi:phosphomannomutase
VHLSRLLAGYAACRNCEHKGDTHLLSRQQVKQLTGGQHHDVAPDLFGPEGMTGVYLNELDSLKARRLALAMGTHLRSIAGPQDFAPTVVVGRDGRPATAELLAAASEGLRLAGCKVIEIGDVTAGCLAWAIVELKTDGGLLVGNPSGQPHSVGLKLWGRRAEPWSAIGSLGEGQLEAVHTHYAAGSNRPVRRGGSMARHGAMEPYLTRLGELFHALRPLTVVLDSSSQPLAACLRRLLSNSACQVLAPGSPPASSGAERPKPQATALKPPTFVQRRLRLVSNSVRRHSAHFGLWADGDAEVCYVVDERGRTVDPERLTMLLVGRLLSDRPGAAVVLELGASTGLVGSIARLGGTVATSAASREAMYAAVDTHRAVLGGGASGRLWFGADWPICDALLLISLLLGILSQTDRPLSEVLDSAAAGE